MRGWVIGAAALAAAGCATTNPYQPCSSPWVAVEARAAFDPVRRDASRALDRLQGAQAAMNAEGGAGLGAVMRLTFAMESGLRVLETTEQQTLPRLQAAAAQCDDPQLVRRAVFDFLDEQGVGDLFAGEDGFAPLAFALEQMLAEPVGAAPSGS